MPWPSDQSCHLVGPVPGLEEARQYFRLLYGDGAKGYLNLCRFDGKPVQWFPASELDSIAYHAFVLAYDCNVYHSIGLRSEAYFEGLDEPGRQRGGSDAVAGLPGLWLDVDFRDAVHSKKSLPPTAADALRLIAELPLEPTLVVHSGHGFQAWFLFHAIWELQADEERGKAEALLHRFHEMALCKARDHGWTLDNTSDLARVFRVAGTVNWKNANQPLPVTMARCNEARRYHPDDFAPYLLPERIEAPHPANTCSLPLVSNSLLGDEELVQRALAAKDDGKFARLWAGDTSDFGGDESAADMSLCDKLAFWTNRDPMQMDRLFRQSGRYRDKWDEVHYATGETYGQHTIGEAIAKTTEGYSGRHAPVPIHGEGAETHALAETAEPAFEGPQDEIEYLRRALATERAKTALLTRDNERLREANRNLREENDSLQAVHSRQWRVIGNRKLKGVGHTAVKVHAEYTSALQHARGEDGWVPMVLGGLYGVAAGIGKSAKRAGGDVQKLADWGLIDKRAETIQLTDGPDAGQLRTRMYVRLKDPDTFLEDLAQLDPQQPTWGGKRVPRCADHPHAAVVRTTTYLCQECGQILEEPREQLFPPDGQDVPSGIAAVADEGFTRTEAESVLIKVSVDRVPEGTRCPSERPPPSPVDTRTLDGQDDWSRNRSEELDGHPRGLFTSSSGEWYTPRGVVDRVVALLGVVDLDPCSNSHDQPIVPAAHHYTVSDDGLVQPWRGRVYMNPPYGREIEKWVRKLVDEYGAGRVTEAVALLPARTDTRWFQRLRSRPICLIRGRLKFSDCPNAAPFPSALVYFGARSAEFRRAFADIGDTWESSQQAEDDAGMPTAEIRLAAAEWTTADARPFMQTAEASSNALYDLALERFPGSRFVEDGP